MFNESELLIIVDFCYIGWWLFDGLWAIIQSFRIIWRSMG